jgi:hypothetical protein
MSNIAKAKLYKEAFDLLKQAQELLIAARKKHEQQPAEGEEIMVNTPYDVFILPLRPSGFDGKGPRFVVHLPGPERPAPQARSSTEAWRDLAIANAANAAIVDEIREIVGLKGKPGDVVEAVRKLVALRDGEAKQPAPPSTPVRVSWADFWIAQGDWPTANDYAAFEKAEQWLLAQQPAAARVDVTWPLSILEAGNWREVYMGTKHMRLEVSYPYEAWERLMAALAAAQGERDELAKDAAKYRWGINNARWIRSEQEAYVAIPVAPDADLSCVAMRDAAIDQARGKGGKEAGND